MNPQNFVVPSSENHPLSPALGDHGSAFCAFPRYAFSRVVGEAVAQSFVLLSGIALHKYITLSKKIFLRYSCCAILYNTPHLKKTFLFNLFAMLLDM